MMISLIVQFGAPDHVALVHPAGLFSALRYERMKVTITYRLLYPDVCILKAERRLISFLKVSFNLSIVATDGVVDSRLRQKQPWIAVNPRTTTEIFYIKKFLHIIEPDGYKNIYLNFNSTEHL